MADRKTPLRLVLILAIIACAVLSSLTAMGIGPLVKHQNPSARWASPTAYAEQPDNPLPPRDLRRMIPDQFDAVTVPKHLIGTQVAQLVVRKDRLDQMIGSGTVWSAPYQSIPGFTGRLTVPALAGLVARSPHPDWLRQTEPGVFLLSAGMVQESGTRLEVTGPEVKELRLAFQPYVYISGVGASVLFQNTKVTSWAPSAGAPAPDPAKSRPFVSYDLGGRMDVIDSEFSYLGTDTSKGYGVSWGVGTTGSSVGSQFHHNLFGSYASGAVGVLFKNNIYRNNARYGLDPHTDSSGLTVVGNEAYGNNTHGIIFSQSVNHSVIEGNRSHDNGSNGIMMDEKCDFNVIRNNQVWNNRGDGIVLQGSSHTVVSGNKISGNSVGVRVNANTLGSTDGSLVAHNEIDGNRHGIQVYGGARDTTTMGNTITDTADQAINFVDPGTSESDTVSGALKAVVVGRDATVRNLSTANVGRALVVGKGARVSLESSRLTGRDIAVEVQPDGHLSVLGTDTATPTTITGANKAVVADGATELRNVLIKDVNRGVTVGADGRAAITTSSIVTDSKGVEVEGFNGQSRVTLAASDISAPQPVVGSTLWQESGNELSAIPSWLAVAGALFVLLAALLHIGHRIVVPSARSRSTRPIPLAAGSSS
jgi:parallel beta-helix repeat protein